MLKIVNEVVFHRVTNSFYDYVGKFTNSFFRTGHPTMGVHFSPELNMHLRFKLVDAQPKVYFGSRFKHEFYKLICQFGHLWACGA